MVGKDRVVMRWSNASAIDGGSVAKPPTCGGCERVRPHGSALDGCRSSAGWPEALQAAATGSSACASSAAYSMTSACCTSCSICFTYSMASWMLPLLTIISHSHVGCKTGGGWGWERGVWCA